MTSSAVRGLRAVTIHDSRRATTRRGFVAGTEEQGFSTEPWNDCF